VSLRLRLLLALLSLVAVGLLVADAVTYFSLQSFLIRRVDQQLAVARMPVVRALETSGSGLPQGMSGPPPGETPFFPPGTYGEVIDQSGKTVNEVVFTYGGTAAPPPSLPAGLEQGVVGGGGQRFLTVAASGRTSLHYRVMAAPLIGSVYTLVVAIPLTEVTQTLRRLLLVEGIVTASVLIGLGALAWWVVRREMRPLVDMATTAGAIAAGDLSRRIDRAEPRTEVGRLGLALNTMLAQIEDAFVKRQASENALRRFLAQASHELRTPLASIRGYSELFRRGARDRPEDLELAMRRIEQEAARMGVLVEELLLLARLDEGRPLERESVDLAHVAADAVADARVTDPERTIALEAPAPVVVAGDEARLRQLVANLVVNALQHAGAKAHVKVVVTTDDGRAQLEVSDDGIGMTDDVRDRAFEPFYRSTVSRHGGEGTAGLGLSIVAAIAAAHGGDVEVETSPGTGTRFRVHLPLAATTAPNDAGQIASNGAADLSEGED
jgi:two-component system OmpR family sensor kinase